MKTYKGKDFYLCCMLKSYGFNHVGSEKKSEGVYFIFEYEDEKQELLDNLLDDYINYRAMVNMRKFTKAMAFLREELYRLK